MSAASRCRNFRGRGEDLAPQPDRLHQRLQALADIDVVVHDEDHGFRVDSLLRHGLPTDPVFWFAPIEKGKSGDCQFQNRHLRCLQSQAQCGLPARKGKAPAGVGGAAAEAFGRMIREGIANKLSELGAATMMRSAGCPMRRATPATA